MVGEVAPHGPLKFHPSGWPHFLIAMLIAHIGVPPPGVTAVMAGSPYLRVPDVAVGVVKWPGNYPWSKLAQVRRVGWPVGVETEPPCLTCG